MKKLMLILILLLGSLSFVACSKKKDDKNSCQGYPSGYRAVTDQRMLELLNSGYGGGNYGNTGYGGNYGGYGGSNGYYGQNNYGYQNNYGNQNTGVICVDEYTYQQLQQQAHGQGGGYNNGGTNCQAYPSAPGCNGGNGNQNPPNNDPYCDYFPQDPYCWGGGYYP